MCEGFSPPRSRNYFNTRFVLSRRERCLDKTKRVRRRFGSGWGEGAGSYPGWVRPLVPRLGASVSEVLSVCLTSG